MNRSRSGSARNAVLIALLFVTGVVLALTFDIRRGQQDAALSDSAQPVKQKVAPLASDALNMSTARDLSDNVVPLIVAGEPAIIMISSRTCSWCKQALADLREFAGDRPVPRLRMITLEGASEGVPMIERAHLVGVQLLGPVDPRAQVALTFRYQGTPTFLAISKDGRLVNSIPGYPGKEMLQSWFRVMTGDTDLP